jgi:hypothetical protein
MSRKSQQLILKWRKGTIAEHQGCIRVTQLHRCQIICDLLVIALENLILAKEVEMEREK